MGGKQLLVEAEIGARGSGQRVGQGMLKGGTLQPHPLAIVGAQTCERSMQRLAVGGIDEERGPAPQFPESRNVEEEESASHRRGFYKGEAEGLIERGAGEDGGLPQMRAH